MVQQAITVFSRRKLLRVSGAAVLLLSCLTLASCMSLLTSTVIDPTVGNLQKQSDIDLVCEGAPAYLLMIDSLIESDPANRELLLLGAKSYSGMVAALESCSADPQRLQTLSLKAKSFGQRLLSTYIPLQNNRTDQFDDALARLRTSDSEALFWGTFGWLTWVQHQSGSPASMADLPVIERLMSRILELDESVENGSPHIFFGALYGAKPQMIGGDTERSRNHFERALALSNRMFLVVQTTYAETYGRMAFDRELHDALLREVLEFELERAPENTLTNQIAKRKARQLLDEDYFGD